MIRTRRFACWFVVFVAFAAGAEPGSTTSGPANSGATNFGSVSVGASAKNAVNVFIPSAATLGNIAVVTQGALNLDFTNAGGGTCAAQTAYPGNSSCTVIVSFAPQYSGARSGAVLLTDGQGNRIGTAYVFGYGQAPQTGFLPGVPATVMVNSQVFPAHVAVDGSGNVYAVDTPFSTNSLVKETKSGDAYIQSALGNGLASPNGLAVDGAGDLYVADTYEFRIVKQTQSGGAYVQSTAISLQTSTYPTEPYGLAIDGSGNLYLTDVANKRVLKETWAGGSYTPSVVPTQGLSAAYGVAVDASGNIYIADTFNNRVVKETPAEGSYNQTTVTNDLSLPYGVAVDGNGNLYIADSLNSRVLWLAGGSGTPIAIGSGLVYPYGVAVDGAGNLYIADAGNHRVLEQNFQAPPQLAFAATDVGATSSDSPQTVTVWNLGNAALDFAALSYPADFPESRSAAGDCSSSTRLGAGATCTLTIDFSPLPAGSSGSTVRDEAVVITSNTLNGNNTKQSIVVTGTGMPQAAAAATPLFSLQGGTYTSAVSVTLTDATNGAAIYYTTNGATPSAASSKYSGPIAVSKTTAINAIALASGYANSAVASATYTIAPPAATPQFSLQPGAYTGAQSITIADATQGAAIYYTTGGQAPTSASTKYTGAITIAQSETINAIAVASGYTNSAVATASYSIAVPAPVFAPAGGSYTGTQTVSISDKTTGAVIYYTTNGATPTTASSKYNGPITVGGSETIRAIAVLADCVAGSATATYTITSPPAAATPVFSVKAGTYQTAQTVTITDGTSGATIYYTTNGETPSSASAKYTGAIKVAASETLQAIAVAPGHSNSAVASAAYTIK